MDNLSKQYKKLFICKKKNCPHDNANFPQKIMPFFYVGEDTPSPQLNDDSPKVGSEVEGSPELEQGDEDERRSPNLEDKGHDPCQSEGNIVFTIDKIRSLTEQMLSEPVYIRNLPW